MSFDIQTEPSSLNHSINSRSGVVKLPSAGITPAELDTIEAEIKERPITLDKISIAASFFSTLVVCVKILLTNGWYNSNSELTLFVVSIFFSSIQLYKFYASYEIRKKTLHHINAEKYLANLRNALDE